jgi:hypothetical protein
MYTAPAQLELYSSSAVASGEGLAVLCPLINCAGWPRRWWRKLAAISRLVASPRADEAASTRLNRERASILNVEGQEVEETPERFKSSIALLYFSEDSDHIAPPHAC